MNQRPLAACEKIFVLLAYSIFFDRCAIPCSLYHPPDAVAGDAFENPSVVGFGEKEKSLNYWDS